MSEKDLSHAEISQLWAKFRSGDVIRCPRDQAGFALAVDGAAKAYRLVCTQCGLASPWFGTTPTGLVFRSAPSTLNPSGSHADEYAALRSPRATRAASIPAAA